MKKKLTLTLQLLLLCPFFFSSCEKAPEKAVDVHIIAGQSNSIGEAYAYQLPEELREPLDSCYIFNAARYSFEPIQAGVNTQSKEGKFGMVVNAAHLLKNYKNDEVYFVVIGVGNTQLYPSGSSELQDWHPSSKELLPQAKLAIEKARQSLLAQGKSPVFKSITWWQGENDAVDEQKAIAYAANEAALFASLDQVSYLKDTKRIIYKVFNDVGGFRYANVVNAAKVKRSTSDARTLSVVETRNYQRLPQDKLHASTAGQLRAGADLFNRIKDL
ncbi:sialate O-acetylesterase [Pontibacter harenae]|uniref:sialate O-acetylesterase n=1 Tax=Pontibacter harenae TaxID=2894083 RepID=UPI001E33DD6B|nr:sialate O-acetylesterase [Pontibacter harenae]MCC9167809.1 sialate O-acetylesterase [Pontibacter harenae]